jgi:hypothetical protein
MVGLFTGKTWKEAWEKLKTGDLSGAVMDLGSAFATLVASLSPIILALAPVAVLGGLGILVKKLLTSLGPLPKTPITAPPVAGGAPTPGRALGGAAASGTPGRVPNVSGQPPTPGAGATPSGLSKFSKILKMIRVPILGPALMAGIETAMIDWSKPKKELVEPVSGILSGITGGVAGGALGSFLGPFGTMLGSVVGYDVGKKYGASFMEPIAQFLLGVPISFDGIGDANTTGRLQPYRRELGSDQDAGHFQLSKLGQRNSNTAVLNQEVAARYATMAMPAKTVAEGIANRATLLAPGGDTNVFASGRVDDLRFNKFAKLNAG